MEYSRYIFYCIIGSMKYYEGYCEDDKIEGGGSYPAAKKHETFNFKNIAGTTYGYVQPRGEAIRIERIGGKEYETADKIEDVLVVWVSSGGNGRVIVGWYNHATVYRQAISGKGMEQRANKSYNIVAKSSDCTLVPYELRGFGVPQERGYTGQSTVWYADSKEGQSFSEKVREYIDRFSVVSVTDQDLVDTVVVEGGTRRVVTNIYERDAKGRAYCIATKGVRCSVCQMSFEEVYGEMGQGFIHVHHVVPVSAMGGSYAYDPRKLLVPVCPNCHAMLHRKKGKIPYTPDELRAILEKQKKRALEDGF